MGLRSDVSGRIMSATIVEAAMGGVGSGARRSRRVGDVEDAPALDIRALRRLRLIRPGTCVVETVQWSICGLTAASARLRVDLSDIERGGTIMIAGEMPHGAITQSIAIDAIRSAFGGWRWYFLCPGTLKRCEILYYAGGRFASRKAQRLSYAVQSMDTLARTRRKAAKLRRRLKGLNGLPRPRGRNRWIKVQKLRDAEAVAREMHYAMLRDRVSDTLDNY